MAGYIKRGSARAVTFEAAGLRELAGAVNNGGVRVARLLRVAETELETEYIRSGTATLAAARDFGAALARTHAYTPTGVRIFGQAPAGFVPADRTGQDRAQSEQTRPLGFMGAADLPLVSPPDTRTPDLDTRGFGEFYAEDRLLPYLPEALHNGSIDTAGAQLIERLCQRLRDGVFDAPQPALVQTQAALLHGDLWSGNVIWSPTSAVLIDPAAQGGHAESDLAQLTVFGVPHVEAIYAAYNEASPLAEGWRERVGLHTLHMLIVHAALFSGGYGHATVNTAQQYL
ncbi:MAG: fructosamine kinase family protein [Varibaculum sp.]|nr:fructosamine kinase family protein [Varibaculum sp.]